jgi:hypothetical protein
VVPLKYTKAIGLNGIAAEKGNLGVISDAVMSAFAGLKEREFAEAQLAVLQQISTIVETKVEQIYRLVESKL